MQIVLQEEVEVPPQAAAAATRSALSDAVEPQPSFGSLSDTDLVSLGTPEDLLARVRQITSEPELDALQQALPLDALKDFSW
jgi:hypothetical protein